MNSPPHHDSQHPDVFLGITQTLPSIPLITSKDSKRVCFYKSGDPQFSGHWVVINSRTFKTFDALLDALSNKVPLPFGVRTITTPKGRHAIQSLDELQHGASYVCSDQRKVKPLNLDEINRRHVPWNSSRPTSAGHQGRRGLIRQLVKKNEVGRMAKMAEGSVTVRTPKRLVVFKNRDPTTKRIVVLQRRTAPTFDALLEYLSQVMQFPVVKLHTMDGRRVEGLPALILCSGVIVAAGNEPFQLANFNLAASTQPSDSIVSESTQPTTTQPLPQVQQKSVSSRPRSRNFSLSSERYFVNQINMSLTGSHSDETEAKIGSMVSMNDKVLESEEMEQCDFMSGTEEKDCLIIPSDDKIEKSLRVNQDGSMTVEMKVRLTLKQEEMIHWTTTVSRASVNSQDTAAFSQPVSSHNSPDNKDNNNKRKKESNVDSYESKDENTQTHKPIKLNQEGENHCRNDTSEALENPKPCFRRLPTPGPRRARRKKTSVENIKKLSQNEVQENTVGTYSYVEHRAEDKLWEGYCIVSHSSSSSTRPVPKPRKKNLREAKHNKTHSSLSGMAEVLQLHNKGKDITETVVHIHQSQDICENYFAKAWADEDDWFEHKRLDSTESGPQSSTNDCDTDLTKPSASCGSGNARNNEHISLLFGQSDFSQTISSDASSFTDYKNQARCESSDKGMETNTKEDSLNNKRTLSKKTKMSQKSERTNKHVFLNSTVTDQKQKGSVLDFLKDLKNSNSPESQSCTESDKYGKKVKKRNKGHSPLKVNTRHINMSRDTSQNMNLGYTDLLRPHRKENLDIIPSSHSAPFKVLTKQRSVNGSIIKAPKESKELSESVSMPVLHSSSRNVHQYVENWLEKNYPASVPYMDELNPHEFRVRFQIESDFSDISEMRSELDKDNLVENCASVESSTVKKPESQQFVQIRCEGEPMETQNLRRSCKSMPSVRMHAAEQENGARKHKSSGDLVPKLPDAECGMSPNSQLNPRSGILEQLCLSIQFIRRACSHSRLSSMKKNKSSSLPDFSSQLASVFGSPSKALLSFLTVMTLRDGIANSANEDSGSAKNNTSGSNPEALQIMQSIQKLASIEDEEELKASLASLHSSASAQLKKSWRDFQEKNNIKESPPLSPRQSVQESALKINSEEDGQDQGCIFGITEVMDELNICEDLRREISSLVRGDLTNFNRAKSTNGHSCYENETTNIACENEVATMKDDLWGSLEEERRYSEESKSHYDDITNTKPADLSNESEELHLLQSSSHKPALSESDIVKNVQIEDMTKQKGLIAYITETVDDVKTNQERYVDNAPSKAGLCEEKQEMMDYVQMTDEKYTEEDEISQVDELHISDYSPTKSEDKAEQQGNVHCMLSDSELLSPTSEIKIKEVRSNSKVIENTISKREECTNSLKGCDINSKKDDPYCANRDHAKQPEIISEASETETTEAQPPNNGTFHNAMKDARSEATDFNVDEVDPHSNDDESNNGHEETMYSISECKNPTPKPQHFSMSDQEDELYNAASCTRQEVETEHELQKSEEESVTETQAHNASKNDDEADVDEDSDAELNSRLQLHQEGEYSDPSESYKGQESVAELDLQTLEEEGFRKKPSPAEENADVKQSSASDSNKDLHTQSNHCYMDEPSIKNFLKRVSCKRTENHKAGSEDSAGIEGADMDDECHCVYPKVFPQQLLDFLNLTLVSSALIFTYDSNGCLRIEPDRCKNNEQMSLSKSNVDNQHARCLPSPNTSDLSDYRPDTSDSGGGLSPISTELLTEGGEDEAERLFNMKQSSENITRKVKNVDNGSKSPHPDTIQISSPKVKVTSLGSFSDSMVNSPMQDPVYCNSSDSIGNSELAAFHAETDSGEGILIDKGRWLLKENHLIRKSPPVPMGMYDNVDTTSVDTGQENTCEDASYIPCGRKQSPIADISTSELEDMAKPSTPKCTYFNMSHSSDSDPFLNNQSITSNKGRGITRKSKEVSPLGETLKMQAKKNGSLPSFASVEFKLAAGKVHPEDAVAFSAVGKSARSQSSTPHEEESAEGLSFRCGQHCPIL